jgi:hypothetical protein
VGVAKLDLKGGPETVRRLLCGGGLLAGASAAVVALISATGSAAARNGVVIPATPGRPRLAGRTFKSSNWSGYVVTSHRHRITAVTGTITVPSAGTAKGFASNWTGIGGFTAGDLIQAGTSEFPKGSPIYFAWYEVLPGPERPLRNCTGNSSCPVTPGDKITVTIKQLSSGRWRIRVADSSHGWKWTKTINHKSSRSSADWILEAPTVGGFQSTLPHGLGTSFFGPTSTYTTNGSSHKLARGNPITVVMVKRNGSPEATPSPLASGGQSFNVCVYTSSCATP